MATFYIEAVENGSISLNAVGSPTTGNCKYGINNTTTPNNYTYGNSISLISGQKCYFTITSSTTAFSSTKYLQFSSTMKIKAGGNISDLIGGSTSLPRNYCFSRLFYSCSNLIDINNLILDIVNYNSKNSCFYGMFQDCTGLTTISNSLLPITTSVSGYSNMFQGCTGLTSIPENLLPATTLNNYCYAYMFKNCTGLTSLPENLLPADVLALSCYNQMFYGCTSIVEIPENFLPATTLAQSCYSNMFQGCTSLTSIPDNLLSATTLAVSCYSGMFMDCTNLTTIPSLHAISLSDYCYQNFSRGCTALKVSATKTAEYWKQFRIPTSGTGTTGSSSLDNMFTGTGGTFTSTPTMNTAYYIAIPLSENIRIEDNPYIFNIQDDVELEAEFEEKPGLPIYKGDKQIVARYKGNKQIIAIYKGTKRIY